MTGGAADPGPETTAVYAALDRALHRLAAIGPDLIEHANRIGEILWTAPRIVVVGRLKAGKSTLVNALIGAPVAETAALEATHVVTVYRNGAPSRAELVAPDGRRETVPIVAGRTGPITVAGNDIAYIDRILPSDALSRLTLIDTPGLATLTESNERATRRALIDGVEQTRAAGVDADAAVFLFDGAPRADEVEFLRELGFTPLNTLGVLSRADAFGAGALGGRDPIDHARAHADVLAARLAGYVAAVVPVSGLIAQTSHTGGFTEHDARLLHTLVDLDAIDLFDLLESDDPAPLSPADRDRLLDLIGEYGVLHGRSLAAAGAAAVTDWLIDRSGIGYLHQLLNTAVHHYAVLHRADRVLREIEALAYSHAARDHIRTIADDTRRDPGGRAIPLYRGLRALLGADPDSPLIADLKRMLLGRNDAERLGLPGDASDERISAAATEHLVRAQSLALTTRTAAEDAALTDLTRTLTFLRSRR